MDNMEDKDRVDKDRVDDVVYVLDFADHQKYEYFFQVDMEEEENKVDKQDKEEGKEVLYLVDKEEVVQDIWEGNAVYVQDNDGPRKYEYFAGKYSYNLVLFNLYFNLQILFYKSEVNIGVSESEVTQLFSFLLPLLLLEVIGSPRPI